MNVHLMASLHDKISEWMDDSCESTHWPNCYVGKDTDKLMADAASAVFDAIVEFQEYAKHEGFFDN